MNIVKINGNSSQELGIGDGLTEYHLAFNISFYVILNLINKSFSLIYIVDLSDDVEEIEFYDPVKRNIILYLVKHVK